MDGASARDITVAAVRVGTPGASVALGAAVRPDGITPRAGDGSTGLVTGEQDGRGYWQTNRAAPAPGPDTQGRFEGRPLMVIETDLTLIEDGRRHLCQ